MQQPDPMNIQIESVVRPGDVNPDDREGSGVMVLAPWELALMGVRGLDEKYSPYWVCPRCLHTGFLNHEIDLKAGGEWFQAESDQDRDERDYLHIPDELLDVVLEADSVDVTVNPSIGCQCCGFHCYLEGSEYRVLSDWDGGRDDRDPAATFGNRVSKLHEHRPDAYERLAEIVEGGT